MSDITYTAEQRERDRRARAEYMAMLAAIQDREELEEGYTAEDWQAYRERTNDESERRMRQ
jgi:hypothetical protein